MNEDEQTVWGRPLSFEQFVGGFNNPQANQTVINLNEQAARERYLKQQEEKQKNSEIVRVHTPEGKTSTSPQVIGMSGTDPVAQFAVESVALAKPFQLAGKGALYGLARFGSGKPQNWARATLLSNELNSTSPKFSPYQSSSIKSERPPYIWVDPEGIEHISTPAQVFWNKINKLPQDIILSKRVSEYKPFSNLDYISKDMEFTPKVAAKIGKFNELYADETINRLKDLGYDTEQFLPIFYKDSRTLVKPSNYIRNNAKKPVYLGIYNNENKLAQGTYFGDKDIAIADPTISSSLPATMLHERNMHGTDVILDAFEDINQPKAKQMYKNFVDKLFFKEHESPFIRGVKIKEPAPGVSLKGSDYQVNFGNNLKIDVPRATSDWYETRATLNELKRKYLYDVWRDAGKPKTLEEVRSPYLKKIDELPESELLDNLANKTNGYGQAYVALRYNNPNFIPDLKNLLKYGAMYSVPLTVTEKATRK